MVDGFGAGWIGHEILTGVTSYYFWILGKMLVRICASGMREEGRSSGSRKKGKRQRVPSYTTKSSIPTKVAKFTYVKIGFIIVYGVEGFYNTRETPHRMLPQ